MHTSQLVFEVLVEQAIHLQKMFLNTNNYSRPPNNEKDWIYWTTLLAARL